MLRHQISDLGFMKILCFFAKPLSVMMDSFENIGDCGSAEPDCCTVREITYMELYYCTHRRDLMFIL